MPPSIAPFEVKVPDEEVDRLYKKLRDTRVPTQDIVPGAGSDYGFTTEWATNLYNYWLNEYSWPEAQSKMNRFNQFTTEIEGIRLHFIHHKSPAANAIPILLIHGWPGSFYEFSEIIEPLSQAQQQGQPSFHCIVPSLPGFCFSSGPPKGWTMKDTARIFHALMQRLGYEQYCVQAGDWGQFVARELGAQYAAHCRVVHLNYCPGALPEEGGVELSERERKAQAKGQDWRTTHVGYAVMMRTRPHCVGWMLQDNPVGLLAFVGEKYDEAANPAMQARKEWKEHIITTVCLYYFTGCIMTSCLPYFENVRHDQFAAEAMKEENLIKCPFGYTSCWFDTAPNSKRAVERTGNLVFYNERDYAGHFACLEDPQGIAQDVRALVRDHWPRP